VLYYVTASKPGFLTGISQAYLSVAQKKKKKRETETETDRQTERERERVGE
jgi:hypothetical protein